MGWCAFTEQCHAHARIKAFDAPRCISWEWGNEQPGGTVSIPGWMWRYDLEPELS